MFGWLADRRMKKNTTLLPALKAANISILPATWVSVGIFSAVLVMAAAFVSMLAASFFLPPGLALVMLVLVPVLSGGLAGTFFLTYPSQRASRMRHSIENNLPFALSHMSAIASSGIPPEYLFELLMAFEEFGYISSEARLVVRNIKVFGMSSAAAADDVANRTPSPHFRQVLQGIAATIEKGGNLSEFLRTMADKALFDYKINREKYLKSLSTYADIYTAVLVAAPLIMLSVLGILNIIGGNILGLGINEFILLITWLLLPAMNILFLFFIQFTYPSG